MVPDYHIHTYLCGHAKAEVSQYVEAARQKGIPEMCFADHAPTPDGYDPGNRMAMEKFPEYRKLIAGIRRSRNPRILYGIEADYYPGCEKYLGKWLAKQDFDLVLGSVHYIRKWGFDNPEQRAVWDDVDVPKTWREYFGLVGKLADTKYFDVVAHFDIPKKFGFRPSDAELKEMVQPVLDRVAAADMAIELNTSGLRRPAKEIYPSVLILDLARERGIPICFGSDAHLPEHVGFSFDQALSHAKQAGYAKYARFRKRKKQLAPLP